MWNRNIRQIIKLPFCIGHKQFYEQKCFKTTNVCIVGSGPAGFYTAQHLIKNNPNIVVDMYEKLPVPFGLVRYGVAPDHPDVKNVVNTFTNIIKTGKVNFFGNIDVGSDITLKTLQEAYHIVVLAYGAAQDRWLGIPGENLYNVLSARKFVGWYNGLPEDSCLDFNLDVENAVIIGQGNVALDVARILLTPVDVLKKTDIAHHALEKLSQNRIRNVKIVGRRGPLQVAFTIKEFREMIKLPGNRYQIRISPEQREAIEKLQSKIHRPRKRLTELILQSAAVEENHPTWEMLFNRTPLEIISSDNLQSVGSIKLGINRLVGDSWENPTVEDTGEKEIINCGLVLKSIGYKSVPLSHELPFDSSRGVIRQNQGRVEGIPGVYCSGWLSTGPVGVIASTLQSGHDVGCAILEDLEKGCCGLEEKLGSHIILPQLKSQGVELVTFDQWERLNKEEVERGKLVQKPREKITNVNEMLLLVNKS